MSQEVANILDIEHLYDEQDTVLLLNDLRVVTRKRLRLEQQVFQGHFTNFPILPGVFMIEGVDNAVRALCEKRRARANLQSVQSVQFKGPAFPGDEIVFDCAMEPREDELLVNASCAKGGQILALLRLVYKPVAEEYRPCR